jgi:AbrB family looped-hinge helix DNA binding protein
MKTKMTAKGQITVPKAVRERLGLRPGDQLDVVDDEGRLVARRLTPVDPIDSVYGIISLPQGTDEFIRELRGGPGPDDHGG